MDKQREQEESLREAACVGDEDAVHGLLEKGINVNAQHAMNGWSALHWAAKRGHVAIMTRLIQAGATVNLKTTKGETAAELASDPAVQRILGGEVNGNVSQPELPITPNYLRHPTFPYGGKQQPTVKQSSNPYSSTPPDRRERMRSEGGYAKTCPVGDDDELVLKARLAGTGDPDFIEIEVPYASLTFDNLLTIMARELNVDKRAIQKVRKLPNTVVRKDKDVRRLTDFQEMEVVLTTYAVSQHSRNTGGPTPRHIDVVY